MKILILALLLICATAGFAADRIVLARFEITNAAFVGKPREREAIIFYREGREVSVEQMGHPRNHGPIPIGTFASLRLLDRLDRINFPSVDYQKHFEALAKQPARPGHSVIPTDGKEVEVEMNIGGTHILFRLWNPEGFLWNHDDDKADAAVSAAVDAFAITVGKGMIYF